jgi:hypothetical protein
MRKWPLIAAGIAAVMVIAAIVVFTREWPFTRNAVERDLAQASSGSVQIRSFRQTYFPHPGAVAEGVVIRYEAKEPLFISIERLTIQASYLGMLRHHVSLLRTEGAHAVLPSGEAVAGRATLGRSKTVIDQLQADGTLLEIGQPDGAHPATRITLQQFRMHDLGSHHAMAFQVALLVPKPPGEARATGELGPWRSDDPRQTRIAGSYSFRHADLSALHGVAGVLSSQGKFQGPLSSIQVEGATEMPDFEVAGVRHRERLNTKFHAVVDASTGDVVVAGVDAVLGGTAFFAHADIAPVGEERGKTISADFLVRQGRIQDVFWLFMKAPRPPLAGVTSFRAHATLPPGHERFLRKVVFVADFGIDEALFTTPKTEQKLSQMSERARGDSTPPADPASVLSDLKGHVELREGVARFSELSFTVPGAIAHLHGTYDVITKKVNLQGTVQTQVKLSKTTTGVKSFLMKLIGHFKNNDHRGAPIPVSIVGTYPHPQYQIHPAGTK